MNKTIALLSLLMTFPAIGYGETLTREKVVATVSIDAPQIDTLNVNAVEWVFLATHLETARTDPEPTMIFELPADVSWTSMELVCDDTIDDLDITVAYDADPDGDFTTTYATTIDTLGDVDVSGWDATHALVEDENIGAWVNNVSAGDATWCKLIFRLTYN